MPVACATDSAPAEDQVCGEEPRMAAQTSRPDKQMSNWKDVQHYPGFFSVSYSDSYYTKVHKFLVARAPADLFLRGAHAQ